MSKMDCKLIVKRKGSIYLDRSTKQVFVGQCWRSTSVVFIVDSERIRSSLVAGKRLSDDEAAALIPNGSTIGMSGFTGSGYPKAVPAALALRITNANARGERFKVSVWTGASTGP